MKLSEFIKEFSKYIRAKMDKLLKKAKEFSNARIFELDLNKNEISKFTKKLNFDESNHVITILESYLEEKDILMRFLNKKIYRKYIEDNYRKILKKLYRKNFLFRN